jgi:GNAT superfamily N-acetyltransferase
MNRAEYQKRRMARRGLGEETLRRDRLSLQRMLQDSEAVRTVELAQQVPDARRPEDRYGSIEAPRNPMTSRVAEVAQDVGRRLEGSPGEFFLPGEGVGGWLNKLAYGDKPGAMDRIGAGADLADIIPGVGSVLGAAALIPAKAGKVTKLMDEVKRLFPNVQISVSEADDAIRLNKLVVPKGERGSGVGSEVMERIKALADESGKPVVLTADGDFGGSKAGQKRFYKRHGFEDNTGKSRDFAFTENMVRRPSTGSPLDMAQGARTQRAAEQGFDTSRTLYHGTAGDFDSFGPGGSVTKARSAKEATWLTDDPEVAGGYARLAAEDAPVQRLIEESDRASRRGDFDTAEALTLQAEDLDLSGRLRDAGGQNVMPLRTKTQNLMEVDADGATMSDLDDAQLYKWTQEAKAQGHEGLKIMNFSDNADYGIYRPATHYAIFNPTNIRSVNAAFDPSKKDSANILAGVGGAGLLGLLMGEEEEEEEFAELRPPLK